MKTDGRQQDIAQVEIAADEGRATYEAPRVIQLGQSNDMIRGNSRISSWDYSQGPYQWYS